MMELLTERQLKKLSEHKYKREGGYTLLEPWLQPFWNWTVEKCPLWWAPNSITFIGLLVNIVTALLIIVYNPDGKQQAPSWAFVLAAVGVFVYQTMDSIDGKQARRTGSSSPLGELFDHGCDAVSTVVLVIAALIHMRLPLDSLMFLVCGAYLGFYVAHWVTYCTGALSFGKIDVVEIQFLMIGGFILSAVFGEDIWLTEAPVVGLQLNTLLFFTVIAAGCLQALPALHTILIKGGVGRNGSTVADTSVIFPVFPIFTVLASTFVIARKSELSDHVYQHYPCLYLAAFGWVFAKVTCKIIVAHMCKSELDYWDSIYVGPALLFFNQYFDFAFSEYYVLWAAFICDYLGIYCFSLKKRTSATSSNSRTKSSSNNGSTGADTKQHGVTTRHQSSSKKRGKL